MTKFWAPIALLASLFPATAFGATINLTNAAVGSQYAGKTSKTITDPETGVGVTFAATGGVMTYSGTDGLGISSCGNSWGCASDTNSGFDGGDDWADMRDEIDQTESLRISFSENVTIEKIGIMDLYKGGILPTIYYLAPDETGSYKVMTADGTIVSGAFAGQEVRNPGGGWWVTNDGNFELDLGILGSSVLLASTNNSQFKGFSVASVTFSTQSVPELGVQGLGASAFLLFGAGLMMSDRRRRQFRIEHA